MKDVWIFGGRYMRTEFLCCSHRHLHKVAATDCAVWFYTFNNLNVRPLCPSSMLRDLGMKIVCAWKHAAGTYTSEIWALKTLLVISFYETDSAAFCGHRTSHLLCTHPRKRGRFVQLPPHQSPAYYWLWGVCTVGNDRLAKVTGSFSTARLTKGSKNSDSWRKLLNFRWALRN